MKSYYGSIGEEKAVDADYSAFTEKIELSHEVPNFQVRDRVKITNYKNISSKTYTKSSSKETFLIDSVLKTNPWTYKSNDLNEEKIIGSFYETELLLSKFQISYYSEPDSHIRDIVVLDLSNYTAKKLEPAKGVDISNLPAKIDFIVLKTEVYKLAISKLVNGQTE